MKVSADHGTRFRAKQKANVAMRGAGPKHTGQTECKDKMSILYLFGNHMCFYGSEFFLRLRCIHKPHLSEMAICC